VHKLNQCPGIE